MNVSKICSFLLVSSVAFCCSKDSIEGLTDTPPVLDTCDQIIALQELQPVSLDWNNLFTLDYDSAGRPKTIYTAVAIKMEYQENKVIQSWVDGFGTYNSVEYHLNDQGYITSDNTFDYNYTYNADGYMTSFRQPYSNGTGSMTGYYTWQLNYQDDNLVNAYTTSDIISTDSIYMDYYDEPNQDFVGINSPLASVGATSALTKRLLIKSGLFGNTSKNLLKSVHHGSNHHSLTYIKDDNGRIAQTGGSLKVIYRCP